MIDTDKYTGHTQGPWFFNEEYLYELFIYAGDERHGNVTFVFNNESVDVNKQLLADAPLLLQEVKRLREENETLRKVDWEYECLWTWLAENTNLLNTIEPLVEEWKKEMIE